MIRPPPPPTPYQDRVNTLITFFFKLDETQFSVIKQNFIGLSGYYYAMHLIPFDSSLVALKKEVSFN